MLATILIIFTLITGLGVLGLFKIREDGVDLITIGVVVGVVLLTWAIFVGSLISRQITLWPVVIVIPTVLGLVRIKFKFKRDIWGWIVMTGWIAIMIKFFSGLMKIDNRGIWAGSAAVWGDWAGHTAYIANWVYGSNLPPQNPWYAGVRLAYPFLFDFTSALFLKLGSNLAISLIVPSLVMIVAVIVLLYRLVIHISGDKSAATIAIALFLLNGGLGWLYLIPGQKILAVPPTGIKEFTQVYEGNIKWFNFVISEAIPQRGMLAGVAIVLCVWILTQQGLHKQKINYMILAGILTGLTPFFHTHSFMIIIFVAGIWFLLKPQRNWWYFFLPATIIAIPQLYYFFPQVSGSSGFMRWQPGWTAHVQNDNWIWFWIKNIGVMAFLIPLSWVSTWKKNRRLFWLYIPFLLIFIVGNLWIFQPWENDNTKILRYWYLGSCILVAIYLADLARQSLFKKGLVVLAIVVATLAGALDIANQFNYEQNKLQMWSQSDIQMAEFVKNNTSKTAIFLTNDNHNHWVVDLAGRKIVMGFRGWLWSWGINYSVREADVNKMFRGDPNTAQLLAKYNIDYVIVGPGEISNFKANQKYFEDHYPLLLNWYGQEIFDVRR